MKRSAMLLLLILTIVSCTEKNTGTPSADTTPAVMAESPALPDFMQYPKKSREGLESLFESYSCEAEYSSLTTDLQKDSIEGWEYIEPLVTEVGDKAVNFGGRYILMEWGCGSDCQTGVLIDASTGNLYRLPTSERGREYRKDSLLLITNPPSEDEAGNVRPEYAYPAYYQVTENGEFVLLHDTREESE